MVAITLVDALMLQFAQCELFPNTAEDALRPNPMGITAKREGGPRFKAAKTQEDFLSQRVDEE
jgi:chorismate synthase